MAAVLKEGDVVSASTVVRATPAEVYAVVSDVRRIPAWSPECVRVEWLDEHRFRGWNRRRFGRWSTTARVDVAEPGARFAFVVQLLGSDFTRWSYRTEEHPEGCLLTEEFRMCRDLPYLALQFERLALGVRDRRSDLQGNLDGCVRHVKEIVEAGR